MNAKIQTWHQFGTRQDGNALEPSTIASLKASFPSQRPIRHHQLTQYHSTEIHVIDAQTTETSFRGDGIISYIPDQLLTIHTADCVPVIYFEKSGRAYGISHQGWRGTVQKMAAAMVSRFGQRGITPGDLQVMIGPAISSSVYEVGAELVDTVQRTFPDFSSLVLIQNQGKWFLDLKELNRLQLLDVGVPEDQISVENACTFQDHQRYYSYRREQERLSGQMLHAVVQYTHASLP